MLIESKANGISVFQEIVRLTRDESFSIQLIDPRERGQGGAGEQRQSFLGRGAGRRTRRAGIVWAPCVTQADGSVWPRVWAELVMAQTAEFPKGKNDDLVDCLIHGVAFSATAGAGAADAGGRGGGDRGVARSRDGASGVVSVVKPPNAAQT